MVATVPVKKESQTTIINISRFVGYVKGNLHEMAFNQENIIERMKKAYGFNHDGELKDVLGCGATAVSNFKTGRRKIRLEHLERVATDCDVTYDWLLTGDTSRALSRLGQWIPNRKARKMFPELSEIASHANESANSQNPSLFYRFLEYFVERRRTQSYKAPIVQFPDNK